MSPTFLAAAIAVMLCAGTSPVDKSPADKSAHVPANIPEGVERALAVMELVLDHH